MDMNKIVSAGKDFVQSQMQQQGQDSSGSKKHGGNNADDDLGDTHKQASNLAGSSGSSELFSQVLGAVTQKKDKIANEDIDEEDAARKHKQTYQDGSGGDANSLGTAAALQALKKFTGDGGSSSSGGGGKQGQSAFLALAMSEASKLFDDKSAKGKVSSGVSKQDTIQKACEMALKFYLKSQGQQQGSAGLLSLASKFM